jgi:hypothetical protein
MDFKKGDYIENKKMNLKGKVTLVDVAAPLTIVLDGNCAAAGWILDACNHDEYPGMEDFDLDARFYNIWHKEGWSLVSKDFSVGDIVKSGDGSMQGEVVMIDKNGVTTVLLTKGKGWHLFEHDESDYPGLFKQYGSNEQFHNLFPNIDWRGGIDSMSKNYWSKIEKVAQTKVNENKKEKIIGIIIDTDSGEVRKATEAEIKSAVNGKDEVADAIEQIQDALKELTEALKSIK